MQLAKHRLAAPKNYRVDIEPVFIDQAELHEGRGYLGATDTHVSARLLLQLVSLLGDVSPDQPGIPSDLIEGLRKNDLGHVLPDTGVLYLVLGRRWVLI